VGADAGSPGWDPGTMSPSSAADLQGGLQGMEKG